MAKIGFAADGRITAIDLYVIQDNGPHTASATCARPATRPRSSYQPMAMRWRGIPVLTNTPPRGAQRGPGENQIAMALEPLIDRAAEELGIDRFEIRRINAPDQRCQVRPQQGRAHQRLSAARRSTRAPRCSTGRRARSSPASATAPRSTASASVSGYTGGRSGFDGLMRIDPTACCTSTPASATSAPTPTPAPRATRPRSWAMPWERVEHRPRPHRPQPAMDGHPGRVEHHLHGDPRHPRRGEDIKQKLREIAATDLGGVTGRTTRCRTNVVTQGRRLEAMTFATAAQRAIELGGKYDGHASCPRTSTR